MILTDIIPWLNVVLIPILIYVVNIEKRLTKMETGTDNRQGLRERRCPIETGRCPITRQRYKTSWVEPDTVPAWVEKGVESE